MRMTWQSIMRMFYDPMMRLARCSGWIDMYCSVREVTQVMQELMPNFSGDLMPALDG